MSDINKLVDYLSFEYKGEKNEDSTSIIVIDENFGTESSNIKEFLIADLENYSLFKRLYINTDFIYLDTSQEVTIYYKRQIQANGQILYSNILSNDVWEELDDSDFITVTLISQSEDSLTNYTPFPDGFYYNYEKTTLYYRSLDTVYVYAKSFIFHYFYQDIADIPNGTHVLDYKDHEGYTLDLGDRLLKIITETNIQTIISNNLRKVTLTKSTLSGMVFRFPKIRKGELKYLYRLPEGDFFPRTKFFDNNIAIHLSFSSIYGQLEFLNQTVFDYVSYFSEDTSGTAGVFYKEYSDMVLFELKAAKFDDKLKIIYHLPVFFLVQIDSRDLNLWEILGKMLENALTNVGTNKEDIAIKLLRILQEKDGSDMFLENLLTQKTGNETYFSLLYEKLNGNNFVRFITFMWQVWIQTKYVLPVNKLYESFDSPWMLPFSSKKQFGFYWSNISVAYTQKENAIQFAYDTGQTETVYVPALEGKEGLNPYKTVPVKEYYTYHVYQPLMLKDVEGNNQTALELLQKETLVPAFVLKANQEKQFWSNVVTVGEYVLDIVTTVSGVGNLAKFRHLTKLKNLTLLSKGVSGADKVVRSANILRNIKGAVGIVELSSGSLNLLLNITDKRNESPYKELSEVLFYLELLTLAGELTVPLKAGIRKSAKEAVEKSDAALRKQYKELFDELQNIAYGTRLTNIDELQKFLRENGILGDIDLNFVEKIAFGRADLAESLLLSLKQVKTGKKVDELVTLFKITDPPKLESLTNYETRIWYSWKKMQVEKQIRNIKKLEDKAKKAFELRNEYRTSARQYMADRKWAEHLENIEKNQTWEGIINQTLKKDRVNNLEEAYQYIIESSLRGNDGVDILFKIEK